MGGYRGKWGNTAGYSWIQRDTAGYSGIQRVPKNIIQARVDLGHGPDGLRRVPAPLSCPGGSSAPATALEELLVGEVFALAEVRVVELGQERLEGGAVRLRHLQWNI